MSRAFGSQGWLRPDWALPVHFNAMMTVRAGGSSTGAFGDEGGVNGLNLGAHVGDDEQAVRANRQLLRTRLPGRPQWLNQVHGVAVFDADAGQRLPEHQVVSPAALPTADAAVTGTPNRVLAVLTADCLPVVLVDSQTFVMGVAHCGWRGLARGVLERTIDAMIRKGAAAGRVHAWLGAGIGPGAFEVGEEVVAAFCANDGAAIACFRPSTVTPDRWLGDLYALARRRLSAQGVTSCSGGLDRHGALCTFADPHRFYSYRRDRVTGRMATLAWIGSPG